MHLEGEPTLGASLTSAGLWLQAEGARTSEQKRTSTEATLKIRLDETCPCLQPSVGCIYPPAFPYYTERALMMGSMETMFGFI